MWQGLREELKPKGLEILLVGLDALGADGCRPALSVLSADMPSLIDRHHVLADRFGVTNIPQSIWIDERFRIVRPPEAAPLPPEAVRGPVADPSVDMPERFRDMMAEAVRIPNEGDAYHGALRDWVEHGADSRYALDEDEVVRRSQPRDDAVARGHAHFALATHAETLGQHEAAVGHFRQAHALVPDSWTFRRQAWSLEQVEAAGPLARFWQGPTPDAPQAWPYEGDWLSDIRREGAENYGIRFEP